MNTVLSPNIKTQLAAVVDKHCKRLGLEVQKQELIGAHLVLPPLPGRKMRRYIPRDLRHPNPGFWFDVPADEGSIMRKAVEILERVATEHGPGRVWCLLPMVHIVDRDGLVVFRDNFADRLLVRLRTLHGHKASAVEDPDAPALLNALGRT